MNIVRTIFVKDIYFAERWTKSFGKIEYQKCLGRSNPSPNQNKGRENILSTGGLNIFEQKDLKEKFRNVAGSEDKIKKIDEDIKRLETLYGQVKSSKAPEFEDYTGAK